MGAQKARSVQRWSRGWILKVVRGAVENVLAGIVLAGLGALWTAGRTAMTVDVLQVIWPGLVILFGCGVVSFAWLRTMLAYRDHVQTQNSDDGLAVFIDPYATRMSAHGELYLSGTVASWKPEAVAVDKIELRAAFLNDQRLHEVMVEAPLEVTLRPGGPAKTWSLTKRGLTVGGPTGLVRLDRVEMRVHADCGEGVRPFDFKNLSVWCWLFTLPLRADVSLPGEDLPGDSPDAVADRPQDKEINP